MKITKSKELAEIEPVYKVKTKPEDRIKVTKSLEAYNALKSCFNDNTIDMKEEFIVLLLNRANEVLGYVTLSSGGVSGTVADPKIIFSMALVSNASCIIVAHNHPSGKLVPSESDIKLTRKLKSAGNLLDIAVLDHLIVTRNGFKSLADEGYM